MKFGTIAGAFLVGYVTLAAGQAARSIPDVTLQQLSSSDWRVRAQAVEQLVSDPDVLRASATKRALLQLLDRENHLMRDPRRSRFPTVSENEEWGEYYSTLLDRVDSLVEPGDVPSVSILVQSAYNGDSRFGLQLGSYGQSVVPALLERARDRRHPDSRSEAYDVLGYVLQQHRLGQSRHPLTAHAVRDVEQCLRAGLRDPDSSVRVASIRGVMVAGDVASLPILQEVRTSDPWVMPGTQTYWLREMAAKAIAAIKEHPLAK